MMHDRAKVEIPLHQMDSINFKNSAARLSYLYFPNWSQIFWTWLTGKALPYQKPYFAISARDEAILSVTILFASIILHTAVLLSNIPVIFVVILTPMFWIITIGRLRSMQVVYLHHATHGSIIPRSSIGNRIAANLFSTLALIQSPADYRDEHLPHHRRSVFTTLKDADAALLFKFGLRPGLSVAQLKYNLLCAVFSPKFHAYFARARFYSNAQRHWLWGITSLLWGCILFVILPLIFGTATIAIAIWLPLIFGYQTSALLQFATEHQWLLGEEASANFEIYAERCHGRFCGEPVPTEKLLLSWIWMRWLLRTVFIHAPLRLAVLVGDLPAHDWHHLCGILKDDPHLWPSAIWERQRAIDENRSFGMELRETWGLGEMLNRVFGAMSQAPQIVSPEYSEMQPSAATPL